MKQMICLGDSLTDCERLFSPDGLGYGYVHYLDGMINEKKNWKIINRGVNGFTLGRILENLHTDCLSRRPDAVTLLAGINDVSMWMANPSIPLFYQAEKFKQKLTKLLWRLSKETSARLYLMEPFILPWPAEYYNWFEPLAAVSQTIQELAQEYSAVFISLHQPLNDLAQQVGYSALTLDGIHLTPSGHRIVASRLFAYFQNSEEPPSSQSV